ncbi:MAG: hypothetical protein OHK0022_45970 [Roseiflexaceae bacterium]
MTKSIPRMALLLGALLALIACGSAPTGQQAAATSAPAATTEPMATSAPAATAEPMATSAPAATAEPMATSAPTAESAHNHMSGGTAEPMATSAPATTQAAPATPAASGEGVQIEIKLFQYKPQDLEIKPGTTVTWTNGDAIDHSVTGGEPPEAAAGGFDSGFFTQGQSFSHTFDQPGDFPYFCKRHNSMVAVVRVK